MVFANTSTINLPASTIVGSVKNLLLNGSGNVTLNEDISVTESLMFSNGKLYTGIYTVEMGSMAIISETNASNLQGNLYTLRSLTQNVEDTFGGLGLKIKESTLASNDYAVTRVTGTPITSGNPGAFNGNQGIKRFYTINPTVNNNLSAQVTFIYFDGELNGLNESNLRIFTHVDPYTNGSWTDLGGRMIVNTAINTIKNDSKHPVTHFSTWSLADNAAPLPISLLNFIATLEKESVILHWSTASEINNKGFEIERSIDGINWTSIGFVSGVANSQGKNNYEYIDAALPTNISTLYYRLKQYDWSGQEDWSDIASIYLKRQSLTTTAFPNPVTDKINLAITSESELEPTKIILMDVSGRVLFAITKELAKGSNLIEVSTEHLPSGLYIIRIESATETQVYKIEK
ncbi:MAG: T9SS type A sorting domain-containing protein [Bacteroidetes bacterium]|nr:T9SS type A sorting domain-containing protein [Bacteroidota bacterium]